MKLSDLEPSFLTVIEPGKVHQMTSDLVDLTHGRAQGIRFLCPKCFEENGGAVGTHGVQCWFRDADVPEIEEPKPRWGMSGSSFADLTLSPSILLTSGCGWHGFVTAGAIVTC